MGLLDILERYAGAPGPVDQDQAAGHFEQVAQTAPTHVVQQGLAEAFRSDQTPPVGEMVAKLFGQSNPEQKAGMLDELLRLVPLNAIGGGALANILGQVADAGGPVTPEQASQVSPEVVNAAVTHATQQNPSVVDKLSEFYAQHPALVRTLGAVALSVAMNQMAHRIRQ